jgi:large subunit ribosomal protein L4
MATIDVYNLKREKTSQTELRGDVFDVPIIKSVLHQVVVSQLAKRRSGTASTKTRSEVDRSGHKLWRQKGTGRARVGGASSPTRRGGGVVFGPLPRRYVQKVPKRVRKMALRMALTDKFQNDRLVVVADFNLPEIKTKSFLQVMKDFEARKALIVIEDTNENLQRSSRNVPWVKVMKYQGLNVYDILNYEHLFLVQAAIHKIEEALVS